MKAPSQNDSQDFTCLDLYRLGDQIYTCALISTIMRRLQGANFRLVTSEATRGNPIIKMLGIRQVVVPSPWLAGGWVRSPSRLVFGLVRGINTIMQTLGDSIVLDPRAGILERTLSVACFRNQVLRFRSSTTRTLRAKLLGHHNDSHIFECRQSFLQQVIGNIEKTDGADERIAWPFLADKFRTKKKDNIILLCPEASMPGKEWPVGQWRLLEQHLRSRGFETLIVRTRQIQDPPMRGLLSNSWSGTINELGELMAAASGVVAVDSFPGHFAAAIGTRVFSIFGPTPPKVWRPWGKSNTVVQSYRATKLDLRRSVIELYGPSVMQALEFPRFSDIMDLWLGGNGPTLKII
jgi:ADP-heptose:LPS heptosyltransferase